MAHLSHLSDNNDQARIQRVCEHTIARVNASGSVTRVVLTSSIAAILSALELQELLRSPVLFEDRCPELRHAAGHHRLLSCGLARLHIGPNVS